MSALGDLDRVHLTSSMEHRGDRPYDQQDPCTIVHPNGSLIRVGNGPGLDACNLAAAVVREVLEMMRGAA